MDQYLRTDSKAQKRADDMVGQKYDHITVVESLGLNLRTDYYCVVGLCDCGDRRVYRANSLRREDRKHCCPSCGGYGHVVDHRNSLCWRCAKATNRHLCKWADGQPRDDWDAERNDIKYAETTIESYCVKSCPGFEEDKAR